MSCCWLMMLVALEQILQSTGTIMNYTEAMNIPVILSGESTAGSLLPALCWRHHTLQAGLITRGSFRRQKTTGWWNRHLVPLGQMCSILEMPQPLLHAESDLRQLSKWLECNFSFLRSLPQTAHLLYYSYEALWTVSSLKRWKKTTKLRHFVQPGRQTIIPANVT